MARRSVTAVHEQLEVPIWAPWLRFSLEDMREYDRAFPAGQIVQLGEGDRPDGALTSIRIDWTGDPGDLGTWDQVSGKEAGVQAALRPEGNTMVLLSVSIRPEGRGRGVAAQLVDRARQVARSEGIDHVISPFRPSGFGTHKAAGGNVDFSAYCGARRADGLLADPWLRILTRLGMRPLRIVDRAMVVALTVAELNELRRTHHPEAWTPLDEARAATLLADRGSSAADVEVWECGETGSWFVDRSAGVAMYEESNLWGTITSRDDDR